MNQRPLISRAFSREVVELLKAGRVGVIPTDTIYGIVGSALKKDTVERMYRLRERNLKKPMIVLIGSMNDLKKFSIEINQKTRKILLSEIWMSGNESHLRPTSVILPLNSKHTAFHANLFYLHRGKGSIAFRLPADKSLRNLLKKTGPLVAPSANLEGHPPAKTIREAKKYFGDRVDFYVDGGRIDGKPSALIEFENGEMKILRGENWRLRRANIK